MLLSKMVAPFLLLSLAAVGFAAEKKPAAEVPVGGNYGQRAAEFPPGVFSDNHAYDISDFQGKLLVLFFYENSCPRCRGEIPQRNKVVAAFKNKPVKFLAIGPHDSLPEVRDYFSTTRLAMPIFADPFGVMQKRYGFSISLQNIYQFRVVGPDGIIRGYRMTDEEIDKALADVKWTFKDDNYHARLAPVVDAFEWNQWALGARLLKPHLTSSDKDVKESAQKLFAAVKAKGEQWKEEADKVAETDPVKAFDLYTRIAAVFEGDDLGKSVADPLKALRAKKEVTTELDARKGYLQLEQALSKATPQQRETVVTFCKTFIKKHPDTPTTAKVQAYLTDLGG